MARRWKQPTRHMPEVRPIRDWPRSSLETRLLTQCYQHSRITPQVGVDVASECPSPLSRARSTLLSWGHARILLFQGAVELAIMDTQGPIRSTRRPRIRRTLTRRVLRDSLVSSPWVLFMNKFREHFFSFLLHHLGEEMNRKCIGKHHRIESESDVCLIIHLPNMLIQRVLRRAEHCCIYLHPVVSEHDFSIGTCPSLTINITVYDVNPKKLLIPTGTTTQYMRVKISWNSALLLQVH